MKKCIISLLLSLFIVTAFCQDYNFVVRGKYLRPVKKEKLNEARYISDLIPGYPTNWIIQYVSVEILATCNGNTVKAESTNNTLSTIQKSILNSADLASDIVIKVVYKYKNAATDIIENYRMNTMVTVVPETEAQYIGGYQALKKYLQENGINKIIEPDRIEKLLTGNLFLPPAKPAVVFFTVNEQGEIVNAKISNTSGNAKTDKILLEAINKMPTWKPAENEKGKKVKQEFKFTVGKGGC